MEDKIKVLFVQPLRHPQVVEIDNTLEAKQGAVGGYIEVIHPFDDNVALICNEEGKLLGLPLNRSLRDGKGELYEVIVGNFILAGESGDNFSSLTKAQLQKYAALFMQPEEFVLVNGKITAFPTEPVESESPARAAQDKQQDDTYRIYQVKRTTADDKNYDMRRDVSFASLDSLEHRGLKVDPANYQLVYTGKLEDGMTPEALFQQFNLDIPPDFYGHSMSVSDVVVFVRDGRETAHFCDIAGFAKLGSFVTPESPPALQRPKRNRPPKKKGGPAR